MRPVHAGDKALTRETPAKRGRVNRYAKTVSIKFCKLLKSKRNENCSNIYILFLIRNWTYIMSLLWCFCGKDVKYISQKLICQFNNSITKLFGTVSRYTFCIHYWLKIWDKQMINIPSFSLLPSVTLRRQIYDKNHLDFKIKNP